MVTNPDDFFALMAIVVIGAFGFQWLCTPPVPGGWRAQLKDAARMMLITVACAVAVAVIILIRYAPVLP